MNRNYTVQLQDGRLCGFWETNTDGPMLPVRGMIRIGPDIYHIVRGDGTNDLDYLNRDEFLVKLSEQNRRRFLAIEALEEITVEAIVALGILDSDDIKISIPRSADDDSESYISEY